MTVYTREALRTAILDQFHKPEDGDPDFDWNNTGHPFRTALLANEAVRIDGIGHAFFEQEQEDARDYYSEGDTYLVFRIEGFDGSRAYWRWNGYYSSYDGYVLLNNRWEQNPFEVKAAAVSRVIWETK